MFTTILEEISIPLSELIGNSDTSDTIGFLEEANDFGIVSYFRAFHDSAIGKRGRGVLDEDLTVKPKSSRLLILDGPNPGLAANILLSK